MPDDLFCRLCQELLAWARHENDSRRAARKPPLPPEALGLRPGEHYTDPADASRIAVIYQGLRGRGQWVPYRKGDPQGNRWLDNDPLFIHWSSANVAWLFDHSGHPESGMPVIRNPHLYFTPGVTWTAVGNHVPMKARYQDPCVFDADSMRLTPPAGVLPPLALLSLFNSNLLSFLKMKFIKHTAKWEIGDLRQLPLVTPTRDRAGCLVHLAKRAIEAKRLTFTQEPPPHDLVAFCRTLADQLAAEAPAYLRPPAQRRLLDTPDHCLAMIEMTVNWEAEKLYGVEGLGPFDEF